VADFGSRFPAPRSGLVKVNSALTDEVISEDLTVLRKSIELSNFKSELHISFAEVLQLMSKYPSFTPTSSFENIVALFHVESLKVESDHDFGAEIDEYLHSVNGDVDFTQSTFRGALLMTKVFQLASELVTILFVDKSLI
jgi:hypothetical protein